MHRTMTWSERLFDLKKYLDADLHRFTQIIQRLKQKQLSTYWVTPILYVSNGFICVRLEAPTLGIRFNLRPIAEFRFSDYCKPILSARVHDTQRRSRSGNS